MLGFYLALLDTAEDKSRFEELYLTYRQDMYKTAFAILRSPQSAEDAVHEAFMIVIGKLNKISEKYPDNMEICKEILKKMENEKTQIEENIESDSTLYIALQDKIYLGNMHGSFTRIQTIAHECLHSIQDRKVLIFNFIFSNIYILYFIISSILIIIKKLPNELVFSNILLIISMLYYAIRMFLENDAMTKSEYLAKEYLKEKKIVDEEEVKKIGKGLEELNKGAIIATNSSLFIKIMLKVAVFNLLALIF